MLSRNGIAQSTNQLMRHNFALFVGDPSNVPALGGFCGILVGIVGRLIVVANFIPLKVKLCIVSDRTRTVDMCGFRGSGG